MAGLVEHADKIFEIGRERRFEPVAPVLRGPPIGVGPAGAHDLGEEVLRRRHEHAAAAVVRQPV